MRPHLAVCLIPLDLLGPLRAMSRPSLRFSSAVIEVSGTRCGPCSGRRPCMRLADAIQHEASSQYAPLPQSAMSCRASAQSPLHELSGRLRRPHTCRAEQQRPLGSSPPRPGLIRGAAWSYTFAMASLSQALPAVSYATALCMVLEVDHHLQVTMFVYGQRFVAEVHKLAFGIRECADAAAAALGR